MPFPRTDVPIFNGPLCVEPALWVRMIVRVSTRRSFWHAATHPTFLAVYGAFGRGAGCSSSSRHTGVEGSNGMKATGTAIHQVSAHRRSRRGISWFSLARWPLSSFRHAVYSPNLTSA